MTIEQDIRSAFELHFDKNPAYLVRAPGRVNLIGEHTDYNDGFVLPMAIDRAIWIAFRPRTDRQVRVYSLDFDQAEEFNLDSVAKGRGWIEYIKGVAHELLESGAKLSGWEGVLSGDVPRGAGLSSSAALELAAARAFTAVSGLDWDPSQMAKLSQKAENEWVGMKCGIMDQMVSAAARQGHALFLDCRSLEYQHIPLPEDVAVVVLDTSTRRGLVDSAYNERRAQCEEAAAELGVTVLRDVSVEEFNLKSGRLASLPRRRARHVISENYRVLETIEAMRLHNNVQMGKLLEESHASLRDDFEVSSPALNQIVEAARAQPGCYGARMTGAGFGGCAVAIVEQDKAAAFTQAVSEAYQNKSGLQSKVYVCQPAAGAGLIAHEK